MSRRTAIRARHADWLTLVEPTGPFLTLAVLDRVLPSGLDPTSPDRRAALRERIETLGAERSARVEFIDWILRDLLEFGDLVRSGQEIPTTLTVALPEHGARLAPDFAIVGPSSASHPEGAARLLVCVYEPGTNFTTHLPHESWSAGPIDRMITLLRLTGVQCGIVTDGDRFTLVWAPASGPTGRATWISAIFTEAAERSLLDSFCTVLGARRFFAVPPNEQLESLLAESSEDQAAVTGQLGLQVRRATELLVTALSRATRRAPHRELLHGIDPHTVYEAAATVMMRLVFLLCAEERGLLLLGDELYDRSYAVSTLRQDLRDAADALGDEQFLENSFTAWPRLLATFRAVHGGLQHDRLTLPAYGGRLFDPNRYAFLEGNRAEKAERHEPTVVDDQSVLGILDALQVLRFHDGSVTETRRLSFRALDVEQIGHVYEGLLDHGARSTNEIVVGLIGKKGYEPELPLADIHRAHSRDIDAYVAYLVEETGNTANAIRNRLAAEPDDLLLRRLRVACDNDDGVFARVKPYATLLRTDLRGLPVVLLPGDIYVTEISHRRDTGTEYTPKELAEEVVNYALEPLVYAPGPADGADPSNWQRKSSSEILDLRVCDPAVGSGAFLTAACRYLGQQLVDAWTAEGNPIIAELGRSDPESDGVDDLTVEARRRVAERCLYGVDRDVIAVEMTKLSLWLTTMAKERPFSFLDHAIKAGDSLLGITSLQQVERFHIDPERAEQTFNFAGDLSPRVKEALDARRKLEAIPVVTVRDAEEKARLHEQAQHALRAVEIVADLVVGAALSTAPKGNGKIDDRLASIAPKVQAAFDPVTPDDERAELLDELATTAETWLNMYRPPGTPLRHPLHWPLAFCEVFDDRSGFDCVIGNPPFLGGQRLTGRLGDDMRECVVAHVARGARGSADLVAYFFLRAIQIGTRFGLLATNTISQGDTREVGLDQICSNGWTIDRAVKSMKWPGSATLEIAKVWASHTAWTGDHWIGSARVAGVSSSLEQKALSGHPDRLAENKNQSFIGSYLWGNGFAISHDEARLLVASDQRNQDVLFPYLNGEDLNTDPLHRPSRHVIYFSDWPLERAAQYPLCLAIVRERVKPGRDKINRARNRERWWIFGETRPGLYKAIHGLQRVIVLTRVSRTLMPAFVPTGVVTSEATVVFAYDDDFHFGVLSSAFHWHWAVRYSSTMRTDTRYTPSDVFDTFPQPVSTESINVAGRLLDEYRRDLMSRNDEGLTKTYNRVHNDGDTTTGIVRLRELHLDLDYAVRDAYAWSDLQLDHGFHETSQGERFTISPAARVEVLDRLLELNHERYSDEVRRGLHEKKGKAKRAAKGRAPAGDAALFIE